MKNFIQSGQNLDIIGPTGGVTSGQGVLIGSIFGVAATDIAEGEVGAIRTEGVFELPKVSGAMTAGDLVRWNDGISQVTPTTSFKAIGTVVEDAASGDATVKVRIAPGYVTAATT